MDAAGYNVAGYADHHMLRLASEEEARSDTMG